MELGIQVTNFDWPGQPDTIAPTLGRIAEAAEAVGAVSLTAMDHYFQMDSFFPAEQPMLEGYTTLSYLAALTTRVRLGLLVTGVSYRYPGLLAKVVTTVDVLSGGRAELGIGAAWYEREHHGLGVPFPPVAERFERLEETLQICLQMWDPANNGPYAGRHYQLAETLCSPQPISQSHPSIRIGGGGERKTLRLVAQYGDACNLFAMSPQAVAHKLDVLRRHCDDTGRDYRAIRKTILYVAPIDSANRDAFVEQMAEYAGLGVEEVDVMPMGPEPDRWIEQTVGPLVSRLAELEPAPAPS